LSPLKWYYITYTYDGSGQVAGLKLYINGVLATTKIDFNVTPVRSFTDRTWRIGADRYGTGTDFYEGKIDDIKIYNNVLVNSIIKNQYSYYKGFF
jgi:hypothetical protein